MTDGDPLGKPRYRSAARRAKVMRCVGFEYDLPGAAFLSAVWDRLAKSSRNFASNAGWIAFCN